ncbi:MAG: hypothetical protein LAE24_12195 [Candidatus Contendobacter sp.]|nr:hypothetical protein [Candidatus Contendobacter sp.]
MSALAALRTPDHDAHSVRLDLRTLTPLYTGGVGQHGDQIHPSGLLGGLRKFSCLLAATVGDGEFEHAVWGTPTDAKNHHAKQVALRVDASGLKKMKDLPARINWDRPDGQRRQGWFYNIAHDGVLHLTLTRCGLNDAHWQLLLLALRIQLRHATFGSRDQWGLGVLTTDELPVVEPLPPLQTVPLSDRPGLQRALFAEIQFNRSLPDHWPARLEQGLRWREKLRGSFRKPGEDDLRHYLFGQLNRYGSAINLSALYPHGNNGCALRIWGVIPHTTPPRFADQRSEIVQTLRQAMTQGPEGVWPGERRIVWQDGAAHQADFSHWINQLAGVVA